MSPDQHRIGHCRVCGITSHLDYSECCTGCAPISQICCTSAEEGIKYGIPGTKLADLQRASKYEIAHANRKSVVKALDRAIRKLEAK